MIQQITYSVAGGTGDQLDYHDYNDVFALPDPIMLFVVSARSVL